MIDFLTDDPPQSAPVVWADQPEMTSMVGSGNVTLVCFGQYTQKELTEASWKLNNTEFDSSKPDTRIYYKNYFYKRGQSRHIKMSLIIQNVTLADSRNYTCAATTPSGYDEAFVYLRVKKGMLRSMYIFDTFSYFRNYRTLGVAKYTIYNPRKHLLQNVCTKYN